MSALGSSPTTQVPHEAYLGALASLDRLGATSLRRLLALGPPAAVWAQVQRGGLPAPVVRDLPAGVRGAAHGWARQARGIDPGALWKRWTEAGIGVVSLGSPSYPRCLVDDPEPPIVLFHRGDPEVLAGPRVAVVGTRRATGYGRRFALELGSDLASSGVCVVSGLALGIDAAAHRGSLAGGPGAVGPAAVVGGGVDAPGPATNAELARDVVAAGVVVSEVPPGTPPAPWRFPVRNRILAGLAQVVVVVESAATGGSLLTVEQALVRDRVVLAVPGPVDSGASVGTNRLIADGAGVCTGAGDVLLALGLSSATLGAASVRDERVRPTGDAAAVLDVLGFGPVPVESLARSTRLDVGRLSVAIGELERSGWAERRGPFVERSARVWHH